MVTMKKIVSLAFCLGLLLFTSVASANPIDDTIEQIIQWKKQEQGIQINQPLLQNPLLKQATSTVGDWYPFSLGRIGYTDDYEAYLAVAEKNVQTRYQLPQKLDETKATEWHRISLAILATGGDPTNINGINLIADGTYNRALTTSLGTQGINGWIWGLITLDSMRYAIPSSASTTRKEIIEEILKAQLPDGGFSLYHDTADADITAMALQALAPYVNSFQSFTYTQQAINTTVTKTVRTVVEEALATLSKLQTKSGDFTSWGESNAESTAQVLVALSALQIDPLTDARFIKNGKTILDGIMRYQQADGGFIHSENYNPENPTSLPDESNSMASEQVLYALIAYKRATENFRALYDIRAEQNNALKQQIEQLEQAILSADLTKRDRVTELLQMYAAIPVDEVMYIDHFEQLQQAVVDLKVDYETPSFSEQMSVTTNGKGIITPLLANDMLITITQEEVSAFIEKQEYTTADYNTALRYMRYAEAHPELNLIESLSTIVKKIELIQEEIDSLNEEILQNIYPISSITLQDKEIVQSIQKRFLNLAESDQQQIVNYEDLQQLEALLHSLQREKWIKQGLILGSIILIIVLGWRIKKRRQGETQ